MRKGRSNMADEEEGVVEGAAKGIARIPAGEMSAKGGRVWTVGALERALLERFPAADAESWDRTGLLVGDASAGVRGVAVALDPTVAAVRAAAGAGANVLVTHHPAFLDAPVAFGPIETGITGPGAVVFEAVRRGVALMNFHTALDVSAPAARMLPGMLGLSFESILDVVRPASGKGYGQVCTFGSGEALTLRQLAARCLSLFGRPPRVWGDMDHVLDRVVTATGSASDLLPLCAQRGVSCLVCGEVRYHAALDASQAGVCIIELGHDVSELPLCAILAKEIESIGIGDGDIHILDQRSNWTVPEAIRR